MTQVAIQAESVPDSAFAGDVPLLAVIRGDYVAEVRRGTLAVADTEGNTAVALGDVSQPVFLRSSAKPFQVMPAILGGALERYRIGPRELAVLCSSHRGEPRHTETVLGILAKLGLDESALACGIHPPVNEAVAEARIRAGIEASPVCNNCSGAHTGMLMACLVHGWPIDGYGDPDHPLQLMTREILADFAGVGQEQVTWGIDNCAVPAWRLPALNAAQAFARLASGEAVDQSLAAAAQQIVAAMRAFPGMVGGIDSFDTDLMDVTGLVSKGGAAGFQGIGVPARGLGLAFKMTDGGAGGAAVALCVLSQLGIVDDEQSNKLAHYANPQIRSRLGAVIGRTVPLVEPER
ncbi:MAG: asparaginase [Chloroflexota bacterium]